MRGLLTEEALDCAGRKRISEDDQDSERTKLLLNLDTANEQHLRLANSMAIVYAAIFAFENSVRSFISSVLFEEKGADWWNSSTSEKN